MSIYDRPTRVLMHEYAAESLQPGQIFTRDDAVRWFARRYPKIKAATVRMHVSGMSVNATERKHHRTIRAGSGHDLFFKLGPSRFRLWDSKVDPAPIYRELSPSGDETNEQQEFEDQDDGGAEDIVGSPTFALESHLRDYLAQNLSVMEPGLRLYEEEEINGVEFPVGGRFIDILAQTAEGNFVVIELKVSRGYDRTVGQILRYMGWVRENLADGKSVRGVIVASQITEDLKLAASCVADISLMEYTLSFAVRPASSNS